MPRAPLALCAFSRSRPRSLLLLLLLSASACALDETRPPVPPASFDEAPGPGPAPAPMAGVAPDAPMPTLPPTVAPSQIGLATWYGAALAGHRTASGERFDPRGMTAAHRTLPLGTWVLVRLVATGREVRVRINDRGPTGDPKRILDVSRAAADALGLTALGVSPVEVWVLR